MATIFLPNYAPRVLYRVVMLKGGKWSPYSNYHKYLDAEPCAAGLVTGGHAAQVDIIEIRSDGGRIVAHITSEPANGWPHGKAKVRKV
jgi:hypothetical protein